MEKFHIQKHTEKPEEDITRRELFRRGAKALTGAAATVALSHFEALAAFSAELKEGTPLRQGYEEMVRNVFENDKEMSAIASMRKNGRGTWYGVTEGNMMGVVVPAKTITRAVEKIAKEKGVEMIVDAHTHPISNYGEDEYRVRINLGEEEIAEMKKGKRPLISMPPSMLDIEGHQKLSLSLWQRYRLDPSRFFSAVFDPRGTWYHCVDIPRTAEILRKKGIMMKMRTMFENKIAALPEPELNALFERVQETDTHISQLSSLGGNDTALAPPKNEHERMRATLFAYLRSDDEDFVGVLLTTNEEKKLRENGMQIEQELSSLEQKFYDTTTEFMTKSMKGDLTAEDHAIVKEVYAEQGATLEFKSYQSMGLSYKDLHKR